MASYVGIYTNDFGSAFKLARLPVYAVLDGSRTATTTVVDLLYVPPVFVAAFSVADGPTCQIPSGTSVLRHARAWYQENAYLHIPCPWLGASPEFQQFFEQLNQNPALFLVQLEGERISEAWTGIFTK